MGAALLGDPSPQRATRLAIPFFIGIQDTAAEITSLVFDLTGCAMACDTGDFAVDKLISENPPAAVPGPIAGAGLPGLTLGRCWPSRLVATAEEDRLNILR